MGFDTAGPSINGGNSQKSGQIYYIGTVTYLYKDGTKRIKVRLQDIDNAILDEELPDAFPLLPKTFGSGPKKGEKVFVFISNLNDAINDRLYIGPITSQPQYIKESTIMTATSALSSGKTPLGADHTKIVSAKGVYSENSDVTIEGRDNADIVFKDKEINIRVGKHTDTKIDGVPLSNTKNPTYIQLRHDVSLYGSDTLFSTLNLVSDKINLITNTGELNLNNPDKLIDDDTMVKILSNAHPLPYGDVLIEYITLITDVLLNHVHPYDGLKPENVNGEVSIKKLREFDVKSILAKNIKIK